jgi:hypothetical protein
MQLRSFSSDQEPALSSGGLRQIPGVGETSAAIIEKLHLVDISG